MDKEIYKKLSELIDKHTDNLQDPDTFDAVCNFIDEAQRDLVKKMRRWANGAWRFPGALGDGRHFIGYYKFLRFLDTFDGGEEFKCPDCGGSGSFWEGGAWSCVKCGYKTNVFSLSESEEGINE